VSVRIEQLRALVRAHPVKLVAVDVETLDPRTRRLRVSVRVAAETEREYFARRWHDEFGETPTRKTLDAWDHIQAMTAGRACGVEDLIKLRRKLDDDRARALALIGRVR